MQRPPLLAKAKLKYQFFLKEGRHYKRGRKIKNKERIKERIEITQRPQEMSGGQDLT
jgi:hypothetical protein